MARAKKSYVPQAQTTTIQARVKLTVKVRDNYVSVENMEERTVPVNDNINVGKEWEALNEDVWEVTDMELSDILKKLTKKKV